MRKRDYDKEFESNGLTIVCDLKSWLYLKDVEIDYSDDLLNGGSRSRTQTQNAPAAAALVSLPNFKYKSK